LNPELPVELLRDKGALRPAIPTHGFIGAAGAVNSGKSLKSSCLAQSSTPAYFCMPAHDPRWGLLSRFGLLGISPKPRAFDDHQGSHGAEETTVFSSPFWHSQSTLWYCFSPTED
jgi:hypothetical protein